LAMPEVAEYLCYTYYKWKYQCQVKPRMPASPSRPVSLAIDSS
jgi:hypothetical protein